MGKITKTCLMMGPFFPRKVCEETQEPFFLDQAYWLDSCHNITRHVFSPRYVASIRNRWEPSSFGSSSLGRHNKPNPGHDIICTIISIAWLPSLVGAFLSSVWDWVV